MMTNAIKNEKITRNAVKVFIFTCLFNHVKKVPYKSGDRVNCQMDMKMLNDVLVFVKFAIDKFLNFINLIL